MTMPSAITLQVVCGGTQSKRIVSESANVDVALRAKKAADS
jgi:hypothetical protein